MKKLVSAMIVLSAIGVKSAYADYIVDLGCTIIDRNCNPQNDNQNIITCNPSGITWTQDGSTWKPSKPPTVAIDGNLAKITSYLESCPDGSALERQGRGQRLGL